jgi:hypothetical protein
MFILSHIELGGFLAGGEDLQASVAAGLVRPARDLLMDYLLERQPALDYACLESISASLAGLFWARSRPFAGHRLAAPAAPGGPRLETRPADKNA